MNILSILKTEEQRKAYFEAMNNREEAEKKLRAYRIEAYNNRHGELDESLYNCKVCLNRGYTAFYNEITEQEEHKECKCLKIRKTLKEMQESGMYELLEKCTFENFEICEAWQERIYNTAKKYVEASKPETWFYIGGQSGAGKTHISTAICNKLFEKGLSGKYLSWDNINREMNSHNFDNSGFEDYMNSILKADFVYIDDFLKNHNPKDNKNVFAFIDRLDKANVKAIFSSEAYGKEITLYVDEAVFGRISARCKEGTSGNLTAFYMLNVEKKIERNYRMKGLLKTHE